MRSSELIIKSQKQMSRSSFEHKFHELNYFELEFFSQFLEFIIHLTSSSNIFVNNNQFNSKKKTNCVLNKILTITCSISPLAHPLAPSSKAGISKAITKPKTIIMCRMHTFGNIWITKYVDFF